MGSPIISSSSPHVLIFPFPLQGHVNSMLQLAELLCLANLRVTFVNSTHNHEKLTRFTDLEAGFARYPGFQLEAVSDGLPEDHPRTGGSWLKDLYQGLTPNATLFLRDILLGSARTGTGSSRVTCLIVDGMFSFVYGIAEEAKVPVVVFKTASACGLWTNLCAPKLIQAGELPIKDNDDMDQLVENVDGMGSFLRRRDLPGFCRVKDISDPVFQKFIHETLATRQAHSLILNTFQDLEGPILAFIKSQYPRVYAVGPLFAHLKYRLKNPELDQTTTLLEPNNGSSSSLREVDRSCIQWLDHKPDRSVVYVSFGSLTTLTANQLIEFWVGLVQSKKYFLWVGRPDLIVGSSNPTSMTQLLEATEERGCIVGWAPQEEVLTHRAVGGFLTHSGWNSTLESITAGVPMLCWPYFADQSINSRFVSQVWRVGLDMKDTCDRNVVEKMIHDLMDSKRDELERSIATMSNLAKKSITEGGSSYFDLDQLIEDIILMSVTEQGQ